MAEVEEPGLFAGAMNVPRRVGSHSLVEFPLDVVRIECERCGRAGSYRRDGLMARFGPDIAPHDLLVALSSCERRADFSKPCGARYTDLTARYRMDWVTS